MMLSFLDSRQCSGLKCDKLHKPDRGALLGGLGFSREFDPGKVHEICEPNGSGKTTLLRMFAGLEKPLSGKLELNHPTEQSNEFSSIHSMADLKRAELIAWLPAEDDYSISCRACDVVIAGRWRFHQGYPKPQDLDAAFMMLEVLGITNLAMRDVVDLSSGQRRRINFARALVQDADIIVLDEPFRGLDEEAHSVVKQCIDRAANLGRTIICANPAQRIWTTCV